MLEEKIMQDYKQAMKDKDSLKSSALSFLRAEFKNVALEKNKDVLDDNDCLIVIKKQIKRRLESIEQFKKGSRLDLAEKEEKEVRLLKDYLPPEVSLADIERAAEEVISDTGACSLKDMGRVMKEVITRLGPGADGKLVSDAVRKKLSGPC